MAELPDPEVTFTYRWVENGPVAVDRYSGKTHRIHLLRITRGYVSGQGPSLRQDGKPLAKARWNEYVHFTAEDEQKFRELHAKRIAPFK